MGGLYRRSILVHSARHAFQLSNRKVLQQAGLGIKRPIECADAPLVMAGFDPGNQFLIAELVVIALAVVNVSPIDFALPYNAVLRWYFFLFEPLPFLLAPGVAAGVVVDAF